MKKVICSIFIAAILFPALSFSASVSGHWRDTNRDGVKDTYVRPHERTNPNSTRTDNYSYPGNYNPNSGRQTPQTNSYGINHPYNPNPYRK